VRPGAGEPGQPRPALGLRPWFAFLRRALRLRRLDLAIGHEGTSRPPLYRIEASGWRAAARLAGPLQRTSGVRPTVAPIGLMLRVRSVHTVGMAGPLLVVSISRDGVVRRTARLAPNRVFLDVGAAWVLECGPVDGGPAPGERLTLRPILDVWPAR
jgi:hypothetical protein